MIKSLKATVNVTLGFLPLILLWSISNKLGLILGLVCVLMLFIKNIIDKSFSIMTSVLLVYFIMSNILYFHFKMDFILESRHLISYIILSGMGFTSIILGKPYTMYEARSSYGEDFGKSPLFIEVNIFITKVWSVIYLVNVFLELLGHNTTTIIITNVLVILGITVSIMIPASFPEV